MRHAQKRRIGFAAATAAAVVGLATLSGTSASAGPATRPAEELAKRFGLQQVPKASTLQKGNSDAAQANPLLSLVPDPSSSDLHYWKAKNESKSKQRTKAVEKRLADTKAVVEPLLVDEEEPDAERGSNDSAANAQLIAKFGSGKKQRSAARILGTLAANPNTSSFPTVPEDNGAIPLAGETGLTTGAVRTSSGTIGDGPHGTVTGDGSGDFDYYAIRGAAAGQRLNVDIDTAATSGLDSILVLWNAEGEAIALSDDATPGESLDSTISISLPAAGDYFAMVAGFPTLPDDPFDSGSGTGAEPDFGGEGPYDISFGLDASDVDFYAVNLKAGDVLSGSGEDAATRLTVFDPGVREVFGSSQDFSSIYPILSPLAGGGNAVVDHVAAEDGTYYLAVEGDSGDYDVTLEVYRPGPEVNKATQTIFLDFDGQRVNTGIFGGPGVRQLSPLSAFTGRWGIPAAQQNALIDQIVATVTENLKKDFKGTGVKVKILNSRDDADPFGQPNVSRLIVGGTIAESGVDTIGIAQSIDPGNFDTAETALILLDVVSGSVADYPDASFNAYLSPASDRIKFVGTALGNIASHEAGHYLGNWHVDQFNTVLNLMDQGGNFPLLYGVGPDGIGGTADDPDIDFGEDTLNPNEGFTGLENTRARTQWGLIK